MTNSNSSAFPQGKPFTSEQSPGLTKREYFAGLAMQGITANENTGRDSGTGDIYQRIAKSSVALADALLTELNKQQ